VAAAASRWLTVKGTTEEENRVLAVSDISDMVLALGADHNIWGFNFIKGNIGFSQN